MASLSHRDRAAPILRRNAAPRLVCAAIAALLLGSLLWAAPLPVLGIDGNLLPLSEYQKDNWQVEDGLPTNDIRMITQQSDGRLLIATGAGLVTFDGQRFEESDSAAAHALGGDSANAVLLDSKGVLWVGTDGWGVLRQAHGHVANIALSPGHTAPRVRMVYQDVRGAIWIATQDGIERIQGGRFTAIAGAGMIAGDLTMPFADDGHGGMLIVLSSGLYRWSAGHMEPIPLAANYGSATAVYLDKTGSIWLGTTRGLLPMAWQDGHWQVSGKLLATESPVTTMLGGRFASLWVGTRRSGVYRESALGFEHYGVADGLPAGGVKTLYLDDENDLWIGMLTGGLSRWRVGAFAPYGKAEGFPAEYAAAPFADSHGALWLGTWDKGLFRLTNGRLQAIHLPGIASPGLIIRSIAEDRSGRVWIATWFHGVYSYDGTHFTQYLLGTESPANAVSDILCDHRGGLWIGTYQGVLYFPDGVPDHTAQSFLHARLVTAMAETPDGGVLVGTLRGLFRILDGQVQPVHGLQDQHILDVFVDQLGTAWAAPLRGGLAQINGPDAVPEPVVAGVSIPAVHSAVDDADGHLWLGTARGILRVSLVDLHQFFAGQSKTLPTLLLDKADGLRASDCSGRSRPLTTRMPDGTLWFATSGGFVHSTPVAETIGTSTLRVSVRGWSLSNNAGEGPLLQGAVATLKPGAPDLMVHFWSKRLSSATRIEFRYRLAGYDHDWTETQARVARYRWLPPGRYRFEVQGSIGNGLWPQTTAVLEVVQQPHVYQTWWFRTALVFAVAGLLWLLVRLRLQRRVQRLKGSMGIVLEERNRIAQECHDTLMAGFAAISWQLEATSNLFRESDATASPAAKSCELARSMVVLCQAEARRIIYDLRETEEVTNLLSKALRRMLEENHRAENCELDLHVSGEEISLPPGSVHHLTRIGQEAVRNALRHAGADSIQIELSYEESALRLLVRDDGCGFRVDDASQTRSGHFGIAVMQERARKVGGAVRLHSDPEGTEVEVTVPFDAIGPAPAQKEEVVQWIGL